MKQSTKFLVLTGIAFQMGVLIFSGAYFGKYLDGIYPSSKKWFTMLFTILSIAISLYLLVKQVNRINKKEDEN